MDPAPKYAQTLSAFLARTRPGDNCVCCGAVLRSLDRSVRRSRPISDLPGRCPALGVACPECGYEICDDDPADAAGNLRNLGELISAA